LLTTKANKYIFENKKGGAGIFRNENSFLMKEKTFFFFSTLCQILLIRQHAIKSKNMYYKTLCVSK